MKFCLEVGQLERQLIAYAFNQLLGQLCIRVNHEAVHNHVRRLDEPVTETQTQAIGRTERLVVRIEKERKLTFGQQCRVYLGAADRTDLMQH